MIAIGGFGRDTGKKGRRVYRKCSQTGVESIRDITLVRSCELMRRPASFPVASRANPYANDTLLSPPVILSSSSFFFPRLLPPRVTTHRGRLSICRNRAISRAKRNGVATRRDPRVAISCSHSGNMSEVRTCKTTG